MFHVVNRYYYTLTGFLSPLNKVWFVRSLFTPPTMLVSMRKPVCKLWNPPQETEKHPDEWGVSGGDMGRPWHMERGCWGLRGIGDERAGELSQETTNRGRANISGRKTSLAVSPPTPGPVGFAHFRTHHPSFAPELAFSSFTVSQLRVGLGNVRAHSHQTVHTGRLPLVRWVTPAEKHSARVKCLL